MTIEQIEKASLANLIERFIICKVHTLVHGSVPFCDMQQCEISQLSYEIDRRTSDLLPDLR